jgi:hypothetical protein
MPLDGLRAWIGEVERKLGMRTRVFLVLAVIAVGGAGAAVYLAVDARDNAVSQDDVQALQDRLEARTGGGGSPAGADQTALEAELKALQAQVEQLKVEGAGPPQDSGSGGSAGNGGGSSGGGGEGGSGSSGSARGTGGSSESTDRGAAGEGPSGASLPELLEQAKKENEQAEGADPKHAGD